MTEMIDIPLKLLQGQIDDLLEVEEGLSPWEIEFIEDMETILHDGCGMLTEKQTKKLDEIWDKHCG